MVMRRTTRCPRRPKSSDESLDSDTGSGPREQPAESHFTISVMTQSLVSHFTNMSAASCVGSPKPSLVAQVAEHMEGFSAEMSAPSNI